MNSIHFFFSRSPHPQRTSSNKKRVGLRSPTGFQADRCRASVSLKNWQQKKKKENFTEKNKEEGGARFFIFIFLKFACPAGYTERRSLLCQPLFHSVTHLIRTLSVQLKFGFFFYSGCVIFFFSTSSSLPYGGPRTTRTSSQPIHYIFFCHRNANYRGSVDFWG
jgi:hypothetical protein